MRNQKFEVQSPKFETNEENPNSKIRSRELAFWNIRIWNLFRISGFGFRVFATHKEASIAGRAIDKPNAATARATAVWPDRANESRESNLALTSRCNRMSRR